MKIFFDHKIFVNQNYGGPSRYYSNLVKYINKIEKMNAKIFAPLHINNYLSKLKKENLKFSKKIFFGDEIYKYYSLKKKLMAVNNIINLFYIKKFKPDILHSTYYDEDKFPKDLKMVITVYDLIHEIFKNDYGFKKEYLPKKKILDRADHIICISESTKKDLVRFYNIPLEKISVTYLATNFKKQSNNYNLKYKINNLIKKKYFLFVGSREKYKNFNGLLNAIKLIKNLFKDYQLVLFGGGKITEEENKKILDLNLSLENIIHLYGDENLLKSLYSNAEFFIYPSKYEGFGIPILESFSQECPVLCGRSSSLPEVAGEAAVYFDSNSPESMAKCLEDIMTSKIIKKDYKQKGLERLKLFSWEKCANETIKVYNKII